MVIIDNYDSFTYNLVEYFKILNITPIVIKNDKITISELKKINFKYLVISPGWGSPKDSGISMNAIKEFYTTKKILGVCLGHQCICKFFGADIIQAKVPMHGKLSEININQDELIFKDIPNKFKVTRYHSLIADNKTIPDCLKIIAKTNSGEIMAIRHKKFPVYGLQFHPEAILTEFGIKILENFIELD